jgi:hypothetical protein
MNPELESFLSPYPPAIRGITLKARALILEEMPGAIEQVDPPSKIIAYGYGLKYADLVCALAPFNDHANLMFSRGATLPDPAGLLQGIGKKSPACEIIQRGRPGESRAPRVVENCPEASIKMSGIRSLHD